MITTVHGVVTRAIKYSESSIIFDLLTAERGIQTFIVGGVRKKNSKWPAAMFQIMSLVEVVAYIKEKDTLNRVKEARLSHHYTQLPYDPIKRSIGIFMIEVTQKAVQTQEQNEALYRFVERSFLTLDQSTDPVPEHHILYMLELSQYLGFFPDGMWQEDRPYFHLSRGTFVSGLDGLLTVNSERSACLTSCLQSVIHGVHPPPLTREQRRHLLEDILNFYTYHLDHFREVKAHQVLANLLD